MGLASDKLISPSLDAGFAPAESRKQKRHRVFRGRTGQYGSIA